MTELADTSAWYASLRSSGVRSEFEALLLGGAIATCDMVKLELLRGARSPSDFARRRAELDDLVQCQIGPREWRRALDVYEGVCRAGPGNDAHRRVGAEDLLIAAAAEAAGVTLVHYDQHFEVIAGVTGQPIRWLAPRGSL
jgi:predicted nucleic acid-binding protein